MISALKRAYANFRGFDTERRAVPPMEGPLKPNTALDDAAIALTLPDADNLVATAGGLACSTGAELLTLELRADPTRATPGLAVAGRRTLAGPISAIASDGADALAIGLDGGGITVLGGKHDGRKITQADGTKLTCVTAIAFAGPDTLVVANGSDRAKSADWKRDLMAKGASGSVWRIGLASGTATRIGQGLAFPAGLAISGSDILVAEAWRHRVVAFAGPDAPPRALLEDLPAYPGRILPASGGGFWLSLFAPRNALVEFVLTEDTYRNEMMATIDPAYWIAPALRSGRSFLEPIQGGARKKLNMLKPWSPSWSYGLVARCDSRMHPLGSSHSRADGRVHGVTAIAERDGTLFVAARGSGVIVALKASRLAGGAA
ncbi:MAG: hypothetical protein J0H63_10715 [Rhizobiales bacterium]|nr:hypothetical protein [Hyphomicrobiales bacterium]MBN9010575.1 hypothetical protein [Hyphomicrobiales bacterium]